MKNKTVKNILSIDVEDYFMVSAFEGVVNRNDWGSYGSHIERNTHRILDILSSELHKDSSPVHATFFCLGWVAERYPKLIKKIHANGHEIASHGYDHRMVSDMSQGEFRADLRKSKDILEDITGEPVRGFRAPSYSITRKNLWALRILAEEGFLYDSSIFPVHHDRYGIPDAPRSPFFVSWNGRGTVDFMTLSQHSVSNSSQPRNFSAAPVEAVSSASMQFIEFPVSTLRLAGFNLPIGGGGYFRFFPGRFTQWALRRIEQYEKMPIVFFIHPWEIDAAQPRISGLSAKSRFRHYLNLSRTEARFKRLVRDFSFSSFRGFLSDRSLLK